MLLQLLLNRKAVSYIKRKSILYLCFFILAGCVAYFFLSGLSYTNGQAAFIIAVPIVVFYVIWQTINSPSTETEETRKQAKAGKRLPNWLAIPSILFILGLLISFLVALTMSISSGVYLLADLGAVAAFTWHNIAIKSLIVMGYSLLGIVIVVSAFIVKPYMHQMISLSRKRFLEWCRGSMRDIRINGYVIPVIPIRHKR
ncbi:hypothetical protein ACFLU4_01215 [Chloroflexota bacterium]